MLLNRFIISKDYWDEAGIPERICMIDLYSFDLKNKYGLSFFEYYENGLGNYEGVILSLENSKFWLSSLKDGTGILKSIEQDKDSNNPNKEVYKINVFLNSRDGDSELAFKKLKKYFKLDDSKYFNISQDLGPAKWGIYKINEKKVEIEVSRFLNKLTAQKEMSNYKSKTHKQSCFLKEA